MKTTLLRIVTVVAMVVLGGCSGSEESGVAELPAGTTLAAASINPAPTPGSTATSTPNGPNGAANGIKGEIETFRNPFAPPKDPPPPPIVETPEPEPEPEPELAPEIRPPGTPPKIRLVGFMNIDQPKVLVAYGNALQTLAIGEKLEGMEVVAIDSPDLTMLFEEREIKLSLFDQAWQHEGSPASAGNNNRAKSQPRSSSPSRNTSTSAWSGTAPSSGTATAGPAGQPSDIPGFGPNAGKPPEFEPPTPSGTGSTPGGAVGTPPPGLPGLSTETSGGGIGGGELPSFPGLDAGSSGNPGPGNWPSFPTGR